MHLVNYVVFSVVLYALLEAKRIRLPFDPVAVGRNVDYKSSKEAEPVYNYTEQWFEKMPIDHYSYRTDFTFRLRYFMNLDSYKPGGPIFFYAGNEGALEGFTKATGLMWDLAAMFNASLFFAEHRFYGKTQPFGNESYANVSNLGYLSSIQALADYATLIGYLKSTVLNVSSTTPVIVWGGSYGGMLASWFRIKFPHVVTGSVASSAPVMYFHGGGIPWGLFDNITSNTFVKSGCNRNAFKNAWTAMFKMGNTSDGRALLNEIFKLTETSPIQSVDHVAALYYFIVGGLEYMAMVNYPYPSFFLADLPGYPVTAACKSLQNDTGDDETRMRAMKQAIDVYYNYTGTQSTYCIYGPCGESATDILGSPDGWPWQECTEIVMEMCTPAGSNDIFHDTMADCPWQNDTNYLQTIFAYCQYFERRGWNWSMLNEDAIAMQYGLNFASASNIIYTNGNLDPWSAAGVYANTPGVSIASKNGLYTFAIDNSAHHLDLRQPNTCDPPSVRSVRYQIVQIILCWSFPSRSECQNGQYQAWQLPSGGNLEPQEDCSYQFGGYPWGITEPSESTAAISSPSTPFSTVPTSGVTRRVPFSLFLLVILMVLYAI